MRLGFASGGRVAKVVSREVFRFWVEGHALVEGKEGAFGALVAEVGEVCAGGSGRVDVEHVSAPIGVHMGLAVRGFNDDGIEATRVLAVCEKERAVIKVHSARTDDEGEVLALEDSGETGVPEFAEGFTSEESV